MKKVAGFVVVLLVAVLLAGCPDKAPEVTPPVIVVPEAEVQKGSIELTLNVNPMEAMKAMEKSITFDRLMEIGDDLAGQSAVVEVSIYKIGVSSNIPLIYFSIVNGRAVGLIQVLEPGWYDIQARVTGDMGVTLFWGSIAVEVIAGQTALASIDAVMSLSFPYQISVHDFPASSLGKIIVKSGGLDYWAYNLALQSTDQSTDACFTMWLPLDFGGGIGVAYDHEGDVIAEFDLIALDVSELDYGVWDFGNVLVFPFVQTNNLGDVGVDVNLSYGHVVVANGKIYQSIAQALWDCKDQVVMVEVGFGDFEGFNDSTGREIHLIGQGPNKTRIVPGWTYGTTIYVGPNNKAEVAKGGGFTPGLFISDLTVFGHTDEEKGGGLPIAVESHWNHLEMVNVVIDTEGYGIYTSYDSGVIIDHCTVVGMGEGTACSFEGHGPSVVVQNTIIDGFQTGVRANYSVNGPIMGFAYNCLWRCDLLADYAIGMSDSFNKDPLLNADYSLAPWSICIGAGFNGTDIGVTLF